MRLLVLLSVAAGLAGAQGIEVGTVGGGGGIQSSGPMTGAGLVGAEVCVFCEGRFAVFGEYSHWMSSGTKTGRNPSDLVRRADLFGGGLRIQGRGRVRPFLDLGIVGGRDAHGLGSGRATGGAVIGGGVRIPFRGRWYVRPQVRSYGLSPHTLEGVDAHWGIAALVGFGYAW